MKALAASSPNGRAMNALGGVASRPLSAAAHARIRRHLVLLPVYLWLIHGWGVVLGSVPGTSTSAGEVLKRDFVHFYALGAVANNRDSHALYDSDAQAALITQLVPERWVGARFPMLYGPQVSLFFAPLARLPYRAALTAWIAFTLLSFGACCYAIWRTCPRLWNVPYVVSLLSLASPALLFLINYGQTTVLAVGCVTAAYLALRAGRGVLAGVCIGCLVYKPQLGLAAAVVFVGAREWRIVLGAAGGAAAQIALGCLYWGPSILARYLGALREYVAVLRGGSRMAAMFEPNKFEMHSLRSFFEVLPISPRVAFLAYLVTALVIARIALSCWKAQGPLALRFAVFLIATVLIDPHLYGYDLVLLAPAFLLVWDWALGEGEGDVRQRGGSFADWLTRPTAPRLLALLYVCYLSPAFSPLAKVLHVQFSVLALSVLACVLARASGPAPASR